MALPTIITVKGTYLKLDGTPETGSITFTSKVYVLYSEDEFSVVPSHKTVVLEPDGSFEIELPASNDPDWTPVGWRYTVSTKISGDYSVFQTVIPYNAPGGEVFMNDLLPVTSGGSGLYASYSHTHLGFVTEANVNEIVETSVGEVVDEAVSDALVAELVNYAPISHTHAASAIVSGTIAIARLPVGVGSTQVAAGDHTHNYDAVYAPLIHNHNGVYAVVNHNHDSTYSLLGHNHDTLYAPISHNHAGVYAPVSHSHAISDVTGLQVALNGLQPAGSYLVAADIADFATDTELSTGLNLKLDKAGGEVVDSTITIRKGDNSSGIRMRSSGGAVDFDKMNGDIIVGSFAGPGFSGTQTNIQRWRNDGTTFVGKTSFSATAYGEEQVIDAASGEARIGAKNSLANLRFCGYTATNTSPASGSWALNDLVLDTLGRLWRCSVAGTPGTWVALDKTALGLSLVDNTADSAKPVSTAQQTALNLKANIASPTFTGTVSGITKSMVGLGNVDDTADSAKPVSTAQQTALNLKANIASPTFTGTVAGISKSMVGLGSVDNTADTAKPVSTLQQTALNLKADLASPTFTGTVAGITKSMVGLSNVDNTADSAKPISALQVVANAANVRASDHNYGGWTFDPAMVQGNGLVVTSGLTYIIRLRIMSALVTNLHFHITTPGATLTSGQCFATLHDDAGVLLAANAVTSDLSGTGTNGWQTGGIKTHPLVAAQVTTPGNWYKIRFWFNGTTGPTFSRALSSSSAILNAGLVAPNFRYATADTTVTTLASAPATIGTQTGDSIARWAAVS
jgi:hypothetical protein